MAKSVDTLEAVFKSADCKLDMIACQLDQLFAANGERDGESAHIGPINVLRAVKQIKARLQDLNSRRQEVTRLEAQLGEQLRCECQRLKSQIETLPRIH